MPKHTIEDIRQEYARLDAITGINSSAIPITISTHTKRRYGCCFYDVICKGSCRSYYVRELNFSAFIFEWPEKFFIQTVRHEYAHMLATMRDPKTRIGHGPKWKAACLEIGCEPKRCGSVPEEYRASPKYVVKCASCGRSWTYHKKTKLIQRILNGEPSGYTCACGCKDFLLSEFERGE